MIATPGSFCWPQSVLPGERVELFVSAPGDVAVRVVREGGVDLQVASAHATAELREVGSDVAELGCDWPATLTIDVDVDWVSGLYSVEVTPTDGEAQHAFFVVRSPEPTGALFVLSTSTWAAYNHWGGPSFYTGGHTSSLRRPLPPGFLSKPDPGMWRLARFADHPIEARRRYAARYSTWGMAAGWANWERLFSRWAERSGYRLDYATSEDLHVAGAGLLDGYGAYVSVGHDEYWSAAMRDAVEDWIDAGGQAAFFSGNTAFWQIRYEHDSTRVVAYKMVIADDPVLGTAAEHTLSTMWSDPLVGRPENAMTGVSFTRGGYAHMPHTPDGSGGYTVWQPDHWAFEGLDLAVGDELGARSIVVGYECDGCELDVRDGVPVATGVDGTPRGFEVLGSAPAHLWETSEGLDMGLPDHYVGELNWVAERIGGADTPEVRARFGDGHAVMGAFERGAGSVFTTGCTDWAYGLGDPRVGRVTSNVLDRFGVPLTD